MLRLVFVVILIITGSIVATQSAFAGLLFYLWNGYFRPESWVYGGAILALRLSLLIGAYVVARTIFAMPSPKLNKRTLLIWLFLGQAVLGAAYSEHPEHSWSFIADFSKVLVMTYLMVVLIDDRRQFRLVLLVMAMSLGFETAKQGWANLIRAPGAKNDNPIVFLGDNNGVAVGTMMLLPILGALAQTATRRWEKFLHRFVAVGVLLRGISTYSRGGFLGAGALAVISIARSQKKIQTLIVAGAAALLIWQIMPATFWQRMDTITIDGEEVRDESSAGRLHFWSVAADMARAKPLTGVGTDAFSLSYPDFNTDDKFGGQRAAHSTWFGILGDLGYPGLVLLLANLGFALWSCWQVGRISRTIPDGRPLQAFANALLSAIVVFCVSGSFLSLQYSEMAWHFVGLSTALHLIAVKESESAKAALAPRKAA